MPEILGISWKNSAIIFHNFVMILELYVLVDAKNFEIFRLLLSSVGLSQLFLAFDFKWIVHLD